MRVDSTVTRMTLALSLVSGIVLTSKPAQAALAVPPYITQTGQQNDSLVLAGYLDATLYDGWQGHRVDNTGVADSTAGLQQAINDARDYAMVTYLPSGTYRVSNTLLGQSNDASGNNIACLDHVHYGTPYSAPMSPSLVGPASGPRPILKLASGAAGFGDANNPKPVVHFLLVDSLASGWAGDAPCFMWGVIRDLDIEIGSNNAGAVGIQFAAAQYSHIENVRVDATGAYAGMQGIPTTDTVVNVEVDGGQYGIIPSTCCGVALVGVVLKNQTVAGLSLGNWTSTMVVGFDIEEPAGAAVIDHEWLSQTSQVALIDGRIVMASGTGPAIDNNEGHDFYISNVYVQTPGSLLKSGSQPAVAASGSMDRILEYSFTNPVASTFNGQTQSSKNWIDGASGHNEIISVQHNSAAPPTDLLLRHLPGPLPWITDPGVLNVATLGAGAVADGSTDNTAALQQAINQADTVFLPRGDYLLTASLTLKPNTQLFGVPGPRSRFWAPSWNPAGVYRPFLQTADTASGHTYVGDLYFNMPDTSYAQTYLSAIDWRAGRSSMMRQIAVALAWQASDYTTHPRKMVYATGHGGGRWYGLQEFADGRSADPGFRQLLVDGTTAPLTLYGPNPEHAFDGPEYEINGAVNVRVLGFKTETSQLALVTGSQNVMLAAHSGNDRGNAGLSSIAVVDSTKVAVPVSAFFPGRARSAQGYSVSYKSGSSATTGLDYTTQCSLFKTGSFDASVFPHCGDGVCDGAETSTRCAVDCGGGVTCPNGTCDPGETYATCPQDCPAPTCPNGTCDPGESCSACPADCACAPVVACHTATAMSIDGDAADWAAIAGLTIPYTRAYLSGTLVAPTSAADLGATFKVAWDSTELYVLVEVTDDVVNDWSSTAIWADDGVELYVDGGHERASTYDANDFQLTVTANDHADAAKEAATGFAHQAAQTATGYVVEYAVPWASLGVTPASGVIIGFDLAVNDNDGGNARQSQIVYFGDGTGWMDPSTFDDLTLAATACPEAGTRRPGPPTSLTVQ